MRRQVFIAMDVQIADRAAIDEFVNHLRLVLRDDNGKTSALALSMGMEPYECLRFIMGAPDSWLTSKRKRCAEAVYAQTFNMTLDEARARWVTDGFWSPSTQRHAHKPFEGRFDLAFATSLPVTEPEWDTMCRVPGFIARTMADTASVADRFRAYVGLAAFGFPEPGHFFVPRQDVASASEPLIAHAPVVPLRPA